jgi:glycine C-acetyltransferase
MQFGGKEVLNWSLNDYLGLNHPEVRKADTDAAIKYGAASYGSENDEWSYKIP